MTSQPPLIDPLGSDLPGPQFRARPGWGGKLRVWAHENIYILVFRVVVLGVIVWIASSVIPAWRSAWVALTPTPSPSGDQQTGYVETAERGEGVSHLAGRALAEHYATHPELAPLAATEHLWAVQLLSRNRISGVLRLGQDVSFPAHDITDAISAAQALTPGQRRNLLRYVR